MSKKKHRNQPAPQAETRPSVKLPVLKTSIIIVAALVVIAYMVRFDSFKKEHPLSFDESVYCMLAGQMINAPGMYNTVPIYEDSLEKGRPLPEYFKKPLFKHPPMFPWLIKQNYGMFGMNYYAAFRVSLLFGVLLIALAYLLGSTLFGEKTGLVAAAIMFIEPVSWIASQKIWMETTLAFFTVLSLCLFAMSIKKYNFWFVIASGVSAGLAALVKYPGFLATGIIFIYALAADRQFFRRKAFLGSLVIPFAMLLPWFVWNYKVYGPGLFSVNEEIVYLIARSKFLAGEAWWIALAAAGVIILFNSLRVKAAELYAKTVAPRTGAIVSAVSAVAAIGFLVIIAPNIVNAANWKYVPEAGWRMAMFANAHWHFYLGRLVELSPFYLLSFLGLLLFAADREKGKEYVFLYVASFVILGLYILWGNYQCRYIAAVVVPLVILSSRVQVFILEKTKAANPAVKFAALAALAAFVLFAAARTLNMDQILAVPNNVCYF